MPGVAGDSDGSFGDGLAAAARAIIADARTALTDPQLPEPDAVHDVRKAFKRWRALLRLLAGPRGAAVNQMRAEARDLMRLLAGARDAQAALDALEDLHKSELPFSAASTQTIRARLTTLRDAEETATFTPALREQITRYLDYAALSLEHWSLATIDFDSVADGLAVTYRRARQLVPDHWAETDADHLHDLRRRVVEHRHQMELVEPLWPRFAKLWVEEAQRLRDQLGACQDLTVLAGFTTPHRLLAPWRSRLTPMIEDRRATHLKNAGRLAGRLFAEKPKAFRQRLGALWMARSKRKG